MFASKRILSLNIGASNLVLAEFGMLRSGGLELLRYGIAPLGVDPDSTADSSAYIVSTLRDLLRESGIRPGPVAVSIAGQVVFPRYVKLPPTTPDKVGQMVRYEAQQNVPFPMDEVVWDYQLIGQEGSGDLSVMLVAVKTDIVENLTTCIEAAGLETERVDVSPMALYNVVRYNYGGLNGCTMVLDMGARATNVVFVEGGRIFSRSIPVAGIAITKELMKEFELSFDDAEQLKLSHAFVGLGGAYEGPDVGVADRTSKIVRNVMTRMHAEINRTINFYRSQQGGSAPAMVLLAGGTAQIRNTATFLRDKLKTEVDYINPFRNVAVSGSISDERISKQRHSLGEVVGVALRSAVVCPVEIDLIPPAAARKRSLRRRVPFYAIALASVVAVLLAGAIFVLRMQALHEDRLARLQTRLQSLENPNRSMMKIEADKLAVLKKVRELNAPRETRTIWLHIFSEVHSCMVDGMWLTGLRPVTLGSGAGTYDAIEISGMAFRDKVKDDVISEKFIAAMRSKGTLSDNPDRIKLKRIKPVPGTDYATEFVIEAGLRNPLTGGAADAALR
ncbi:MAG: type IV pilus assembly protein PilM [bacterium]